MNEDRTGDNGGTDLARPCSRMVREERALSVVKAMRPKTGQKIELDPENPRPEDQEVETVEVAKYTELEGDHPNPTGWVYFVYCANRIKIGYTTEVQRRVAELGTGCPFPITLLMTVRGTPETETAFHDRFEDERVRLEWFRPFGELNTFLWQNLCDDGHEAWSDAMAEYAYSDHPWEFAGRPAELAR